MMTALTQYSTACRALAAARSIDEVKNIRNKAEALRAYALQAKNRELEIDAAEIRIRAERRLGELQAEQPKNRGTRGQLVGPSKMAVPTDETPTLKELGIDYKLSSRAQKLAAVPQAKFESMLGEWRARVRRETERITTNLLREGERNQTCSYAAAPSGTYSTIVVDPPWSYSNKAGRHAPDYNKENRVMTLEEVAKFDLERWVGEECHLYLWVTDAYVGHAYRVTDAWGFQAKTTLVWVKDRIGMGNYYRHQHELCIFAVKGNKRLLRMNASTVFTAPVTRHSAKPDEFYRLVESCSPGPYLDVFARRKRPGWDVFGDQVASEFQMRT